MDFVDEIYLSVSLAELVFRVHEDKSLSLCYLLSSGEEFAGIVFHHLVVFLAHDALCDDFLLGDVQVVSFIGLSGGGDDGFGETLVLLHALGQSHAADFAASLLVFSPGRTGQDGADDHLHSESLAFQTDGDHWVGSGEFPVGADVGGGIEEFGCNLVEHLSLEGDSFGQDDVECRDAVGCHHHHQVVVDVIHVAYLSVVNAFLSFEMEVRLS